MQNEPIKYSLRMTLQHCGANMRVYHTQCTDGVRVRYWVCGKCGKTDKTTEEAPIMMNDLIQQFRRH